MTARWSGSNCPVELRGGLPEMSRCSVGLASKITRMLALHLSNNMLNLYNTESSRTWPQLVPVVAASNARVLRWSLMADDADLMRVRSSLQQLLESFAELRAEGTGYVDLATHLNVPF